MDEYRRNRATGSFILIDESTNDTVGAGHGPLAPAQAADRNPTSGFVMTVSPGAPMLRLTCS